MTDRTKRETDPQRPSALTTNRVRRLSPPPDDYRMAVGTEPDIEDSGRFWLPLPAPAEDPQIEETVIVEPVALEPEPAPRRNAWLWRRAPAVVAGAALGAGCAWLLGLF